MSSSSRTDQRPVWRFPGFRLVPDPETRAVILGALVQGLWGTGIWAAKRYAGCPAPETLSPPQFCVPPSFGIIALIGGFLGGAVAGYLADLPYTGYGFVIGFISSLMGGITGAFMAATIVALTDGLTLSRLARVEGLWLLIGYSIFITQILPMIQAGIVTSPFGGLLGAYWRRLGPNP